MKLIQHITCNDVLAAPPGVPIEQCTPAPIVRSVYQEPNGLCTVGTHWQPTPEELALLNAGGVVKVEVWGTTMPPMSVTAKALNDRSLP